MKSEGSAQVFLSEGSGKNLEMFLLKEGNFIMINESNMVKPEKFDHLHLVYHFTVPLNRKICDKIFFFRYIANVE